VDKNKLKELLKSLPPNERKRLLWKLKYGRKAEKKVVEPAETFTIDMTSQPINEAIVVEIEGKEKTLPPKEAMTLLRTGKVKLVRCIHKRC